MVMAAATMPLLIMLTRRAPLITAALGAVVPLVASPSLAPLAQLVIQVCNSDAFSIDPARDDRSRAGFLIFFSPANFATATGACARNKAVVTWIIRGIPKNLLFNL
jgi:hypothetical protein